MVEPTTRHVGARARGAQGQVPLAQVPPVLQKPPWQQGWPDSPHVVQVSELQARPLAQKP